MRNALMGSVRFFSPPDGAGGAQVAAPVVVDPAVVAAPAAVVESPVGAAPADAVASSPAVAGEGLATGEPAKVEPAKAPDAHAEPTMLEGAKLEEPKPADKPADAAAAVDPAKVEPEKKPEPVVEPKATESAPVVEAAKVEPAVIAEPIKYEFKLPEGVTIRDEELAPTVDVLREANVKPEQAQKLLDQHVSAMRVYADHVASEQQRVWQDTRAQWRKDVMSDEQIGGAGHQTAMQAIARMRDTLVHPNDMPAFNDFLRTTGAGDHPMFLKLLHNASRYLDEPAPSVVTGGPTPDAGKKPGPRGLKGIYQDNESARRGA